MNYSDALRVYRNWESLRTRKDFAKHIPIELKNIQFMYKVSGDIAHKVRQNRNYVYKGTNNRKKLVYNFWYAIIREGGIFIPTRNGGQYIEKAANSTKSHRKVALFLHKAFKAGIR